MSFDFDVTLAKAKQKLDWERIQYFRNMSAELRLVYTLGMSDTNRACMRAVIRARHPDYSEDEVRLRQIRLTLGEELFAKAYPAAKVERRECCESLLSTFS